MCVLFPQLIRIENGIKVLGGISLIPSHKRTDNEIIGFIGVFLGIMLLVAAVFTFAYYEVQQSPPNGTIYPYQKYSPSLFVAGILLFVIGLGINWRANRERKPL